MANKYRKLNLMRLTVCVTGAGADVDSVWEQRKLEARKMLAVGAAESPASSTRCVGRCLSAQVLTTMTVGPNF